MNIFLVFSQIDESYCSQGCRRYARFYTSKEDQYLLNSVFHVEFLLP